MIVEVVKTKLRLHQKQRVELEDKRVAKLRNSLAQVNLDSDDEDESTWVLTAQQMERVTMTLCRGSGSECVSERYRIRVTRNDLRTLTGLVWLNDEVIYMYLIIPMLDNKCCPK